VNEEYLAMTTPSEHYGHTEVGQRLTAIVNERARYAEYCAFSREGYPAVTAIVSLVQRELKELRRSDLKAFDAAKQYIGWAVGQVMRAHGHHIVGRRRVPGGLFTLGAIWSGEPVVRPAERRAA
jgi:hypothetical protein